MEANTEAIEPPFPLQFAGVKPLAKNRPCLGHRLWKQRDGIGQYGR